MDRNNLSQQPWQNIPVEEYHQTILDHLSITVPITVVITWFPSKIWDDDHINKLFIWLVNSLGSIQLEMNRRSIPAWEGIEEAAIMSQFWKEIGTKDKK